MVVPFTHQPPGSERWAVAVPTRVQTALGLPKATWAICDELNVYTWPGLDLDRNADGDFSWGVIPAALLANLRAEVLAASKARR